MSVKAWVNFLTKNKQAFGALFFAAYNGNLAMVQFLQANGADVSLMNHENFNSLHCAAQGDQTSAVIYYLVKECGLEVDGPTKNGSTALHWAAFENNYLGLQYLIALQADINKKDQKGKTPLHLAV